MVAFTGVDDLIHRVFGLSAAPAGQFHGEQEQGRDVEIWDTNPRGRPVRRGSGRRARRFPPHRRWQSRRCRGIAARSAVLPFRRTVVLARDGVQFLVSARDEAAIGVVQAEDGRHSGGAQHHGDLAVEVFAQLLALGGILQGSRFAAVAGCTDARTLGLSRGRPASGGGARRNQVRRRFYARRSAGIAPRHSLSFARRDVTDNHGNDQGRIATCRMVLRILRSIPRRGPEALMISPGCGGYSTMRRGLSARVLFPGVDRF